MTNLLFIEDFDSNIFIDKNVKIIALTPMAMSILDMRMIDYSIPEDYVVWTEDKQHEQWFKEWMNDFGNFVSEHYSFDVWHCVAMLKNPIDVVIRRATQWASIINSEQPSRMYYMVGRNKIGKDTIDAEFFFKGESLYSRLFRHYYISCKKDWLLADGDFDKVTHNWKDNEVIRSVYHWFRCLRFVPSWNNRQLLLASDISRVERYFKKKGFVVDVARDLKLIVNSNILKIPNRFFESIAFQASIGHVCCIALLELRLSWFVNVAIPSILDYKEHYKQILSKRKYDVVVFTRRNKLYQYGLLMTANDLGIRTVYVRHGWDAYKSWIGYHRRKRFFTDFVSEVAMDRDLYKRKAA